MTISYTSEVPNGSNFGCFWPILTRWRGSVYKLVWRELLTYLSLYYLINFVYRYALNVDQKRVFENIMRYCNSHSESIPMSFALSFYVAFIVKRWWEQYKLLPWPDNLALYVSAAIPGTDETARLMRRNIVRYSILAFVVTLQRVSLRVKKRFPTLQHIVDSGIMLESERQVFEKMDAKSTMSKYWMPLVWATNIINRARKDGQITNDHIVQTMLVELVDIRKKLGALIGYDTVCVPLVYTQVVTLGLYSYFLAALMGKQMISSRDDEKGGEEPDVYVPLFAIMQFSMYLGWLKVAEVLINPFGEDDDDFELNWLIDRHVKAAYMIVDEMHEEHPELLRDQYWEDVVPRDLPYTLAAEQYRKGEPPGSADHYKVPPSESVYANLPTSPRKSHTDDTYADYESVDTPLVERRKNWFQRQISRMGSMRSVSTAYSSSGVFTKNSLNSVVYSNPEAGDVTSSPNGTQPTTGHQRKTSVNERVLGGKSVRGHAKRQGTQKMNGSAVPLNVRNRPRIPTPDREQIATALSNNSSVGVALMAHHSLQNEVPVLGALVLSPIQELDGGSVNNTLSPGSPGTAALAQAVLSPGLGPILTAPATPMTFTPVAVSQIVSASSTSTAPMSTTNSSALNLSSTSSNSLHSITVTPVTMQSLVRLSPSLITSRLTPSTASTPITTISSLIATSKMDSGQQNEATDQAMSSALDSNGLANATLTMPSMLSSLAATCTSQNNENESKESKPNRKQSSSKLGEVYV
ncbi:bestrophin 2 isoform X2 [Arctopsyche grandis]|uniref:bestrophin 2 isoform X2 n=1 Tax=Arctopsyche grandis TaxID=121162 RepID=UPI00406D9BDA